MLEQLQAGGVIGSIAGTGLLGYVLYWLFMKHLPAKDEQINGLVSESKETVIKLNELHQTAIRTIVGEHNIRYKEQNDSHREALAQVLYHCHSEMEGLSKILSKDMDTLGKAINGLSIAVKNEDKKKGGLQ